MTNGQTYDEPMRDGQVYDLLALLHQYVAENSPDIPVTLTALADDLADRLDGKYAPADRPQQLADEIRANPNVS